MEEMDEFGLEKLLECEEKARPKEVSLMEFV
jgi:hypothetical protein